jgi:uncharacterized protein (TIGR03435 family)
MERTMKLAGCKRDARKGLFATIVSVIGLAVPLIAIGLMAPQLGTKLAAAQTPTQAPTAQWQIDAGGKAAFDVASLKQDTAPPGPQTVSSNIILSAMDAYKPTGGLLSAKNYPLIQYLIFAYKLSNFQINALFPTLPKWANTNRYDIEARAGANTTKDQFRLMVQALLADRFKLVVHYDTKQLPVLVMVLDKPGKLGPKMRQHPADDPCSNVPASYGSPIPLKTADGYPVTCSVFFSWLEAGSFHAAGRNVDLNLMATQMTNPQLYGIDRPVLNKTGLTGRYDLLFDYIPDLGTLPPGTNLQLNEGGPTFQEALKAQAGLKLEPQTGPVDLLVVDHVEEPSAN